MAFTAALGCDFAQGQTPESEASSKVKRRQTTVAGPAKEGKLGGGEGEVVSLPLSINLPRVMVDGSVSRRCFCRSSADGRARSSPQAVWQRIGGLQQVRDDPARWRVSPLPLSVPSALSQLTPLAVSVTSSGIGVTPFASILKSIWYRLEKSVFRLRAEVAGLLTNLLLDLFAQFWQLEADPTLEGLLCLGAALVR